MYVYLFIKVSIKPVIYLTRKSKNSDCFPYIQRWGNFYLRLLSGYYRNLSGEIYLYIYSFFMRVAWYLLVTVLSIKWFFLMKSKEDSIFIFSFFYRLHEPSIIFPIILATCSADTVSCGRKVSCCTSWFHKEGFQVNGGKCVVESQVINHQ